MAKKYIADSFVKTGGTDTEFLMADGSVSTGGGGGGLAADTVGLVELKPELKKTDATVATVVSLKGDALYTTPGTYSWTCPTGVTSVCVLAIGGGGGGSLYTSNNVGGAGGGLGWKNNIVVVPGNSYTVVVGVGGTKATTSSTAKTATDGGDSYFINTSTVKGGGGVGGQYNVAQTTGGNYVGDGGGNGGYSPTLNIYATGGGGAGGYSGAGGNANTVASGNGSAGTGGAGGAGGNCGSADTASGGGGVGIFGEGANGVGGTGSTADATTGGGGGSGGTDGGIFSTATITARGGLYGGGGGASDLGSGTEHGSGGDGAVRILWGTGRGFPSTDVNTTGIEDTTSNEINWATGIQFDTYTMTGDTAFVFTNPIEGKWITFPLTGDFIPTFPAGVSEADCANYDGTIINDFHFYCRDSINGYYDVILKNGLIGPPDAGPIALRSVLGTVGQGASITVAKPLSVAGDLLIVACVAGSSSGSHFTNTVISGWSKIRTYLNYADLVVFYKIADGTESNVIITGTDGSDYNRLAAFYASFKGGPLGISSSSNLQVTSSVSSVTTFDSSGGAVGDLEIYVIAQGDQNNTYAPSTITVSGDWVKMISAQGGPSFYIPHIILAVRPQVSTVISGDTSLVVSSTEADNWNGIGLRITK